MGWPTGSQKGSQICLQIFLIVIIEVHRSVNLMAYSNFTLSKVKGDFGIVTNETQDLFVATPAIAPSELLTLTLKD